ncbi:MAG: protein translocase subunit SecD [Pelagibacteraceae bacterium]|nr:protein translocase subunit SecD [Pelagibacteraceae bacterium]|tara:strand:+ start:1710 stop:3170 length:1461 start_codon:yes stop_codon:yes gene_type:complete
MYIFKKWRLWTALIIFIFCIFAIKPNFDNSNKLNKINYGLDIQGGYSFLLELSEKTFESNLLLKIASELEMSHSINSKIIDNYILIETNENTSKLNNQLLQILGLVLEDKSDSLLTLKLNEQYLKKSISDMTLNAVEIIRNRVDFLGNKELSIQKTGLNKILLEIPGNLDNSVKDIISKTAKLSFHIEKNSYVDTMLLENFESGESVRVSKRPSITGDYLQDASLKYDNNSPVVSFSLNKSGAEIFSDLTSRNIGKRIAIVLDGSLISAPVVRDTIPNGNGTISGNFTNEEANNLAIILKSGSLPTDIKIIQEKQVGPSLGKEGVSKGIYASLIALVAITIFMIIYYRVSGLFTAISIISCLLLLFSLMSIMNATLTLPGVIGIVLTIGMCVDANVLVYERIKENFKNKIEDPKNSGFNSAFITILDSNLTTLFAAIFLFAFGFGPIRGFSISLIIGIFSSLIVTYVILKFFLEIIPLNKTGLKLK